MYTVHYLPALFKLRMNNPMTANQRQGSVALPIIALQCSLHFAVTRGASVLSVLQDNNVVSDIAYLLQGLLSP